MKRTVSLVLSLIMILGIFASMPVNVSAVSVDDLTFTLNEDGASYSITDCNESVSGELIFSETYNGLPVTGIGTGAFYECSNLTKIIIPDSVKYIDDRAFMYCWNLESITIPDSVARIGVNVFSYTALFLDEKNWNNGPLYIGNHFINCGSSMSGDYRIRTGTRTIAGGAFRVSEGLTSVVLPLGVVSIGESAFKDCKDLVSVNLPHTIRHIGSDAFSGCESLISTTIPDTVTIIENRVFKNCINLTSVIISDGVKSIGTDAFYGCEKLATIELPDSVTKISSTTFSGTGFYNSENNWSDGVLYSGNHLIKAKQTIPNGYVIKTGTKTIADGAFVGCANINTIAIPEGVTNIGSSVFLRCSSLLSVTIPESVTNIGDKAFSECYKLEKVYWNAKKVVDFNSESFVFGSAGSTDSGINFIFGDSVEYIPAYLFYKNPTNIYSVTIPESVKKIGKYAFVDCNKLSCVYITSIESWCEIDFVSFYSNPLRYAESLYLDGQLVKDIVMPDSVTSIGNYAFDSYESLKTVTITGGVRDIGEWAFGNCKNLTSIIINESVNSIGYDAFFSCYQLKSVFYSGTENEWNAIFIDDGNDALTSAYIHYNSTDHTCSDEWSVYTEATCTESGLIHKSCTICGESLLTKTIAPFGHTSSDWIFDKYVTCTTGGSKHKECTVCGEVLETVTYPATGHTTGHWIVDVQPTVSAPGSQHKECIDCGKVVETATIPQLKPATPKVTTTNEIGGVQVTWNKVDGATKYVVYRRQGGYNTWVNVGTTTGNTLLDKNVKSGIFYVYSVRAYNNAGQYSDFVSANTQTRKFMATPKLTTIYNHQNGLAIKWNAVSGVTNGYRVYRRGAGSTYWTYLGTTKNLYFIDNAVKNKSGEYFRYTVIADGDYHSKFDTTGLYLKRLANPTLTSATSSSAGVTVKWSAVKGTTGYYVYRKTANSTWTRVGTVGGTNNTTFLDKTAKKGTTYTYTVKAVYGATTSAYNTGISYYDKY